MYLITGASGFIGRSLARSFNHEGLPLVLCARDLVKINDFYPDNKLIAIETINSRTNWFPALKGVNVVVHCAARAHVIREQDADALAAYREVNVAGTLSLARQAAASGVKRFVFLSSIGVNGNKSNSPFTEAFTPQPHDAYAVSKQEAEQALLGLAEKTRMEVVIIRPPLVYGPAAPGNFGSLVRLVQRGLPLPLGGVHNQRSLVALDNLVSLVLLCADPARSPQAANEVFVVADGEDVSTSTLLRKVARAAGRPCRLLPVPASWLSAGACLLGKRAMADRLLGNLQVDATKARTLLGWQPVVTMDEQLAKIFENKD
jgi:nucleoside-diphosphate-sugar epimerase